MIKKKRRWRTWRKLERSRKGEHGIEQKHKQNGEMNEYRENVEAGFRHRTTESWDKSQLVACCRLNLSLSPWFSLSPVWLWQGRDCILLTRGFHHLQHGVWLWSSNTLCISLHNPGDGTWLHLPLGDRYHQQHFPLRHGQASWHFCFSQVSNWCSCSRDCLKEVTYKFLLKASGLHSFADQLHALHEKWDFHPRKRPEISLIFGR